MPLAHPRRHSGRAVFAITVAALAMAGCGASTDGTSATTGSGSEQNPVTHDTTDPEPAVSAPSTTMGTADRAGGSASTSVPPTTAKSAPGSKGSTTTASTESTTTQPGTDPGTLPQTEDKPTAEGAAWDQQSRALWDAIVADDADKALPFFFPLTAYRQVKGISDPDHDYQTRLVAAYREDIHALHTKLGTGADRAQFVKIQVGSAPQWIKPGVEYNKGAYWRVFDSKLLYTVDGKQQSFLVKSMISWRGEWYVVHLSSIR